MTCIACQKTFIPNPTDYLPSQRCPDCRMKLLLSFRNERTLYKRNCDLCKQDFIGTYPTNSPYIVYCAKCWWSDNWDPKDYALQYEPAKLFMDQFKQLYSRVPHLGMNVTKSENSDFTNYSDKNKNCYLVVNASENENVYYSERAFTSRDSLDCNGITQCELNYWNLSCRDCYNTKFSEYCASCTDCWFLYDSKGCHDCFGSFRLSNSQYVFLNEQLTKDEYEQKLGALHLNSQAGLKHAKQLVYSHWLQYPHRYANVLLSDNVTGDNVTWSNNCENIFDADEMENCRYCYVGVKAKDSQYCAPADAAEHCANCMSTWQSYNTYCSLACWYGSDIWYSAFCMNCTNIFGCVGLQKSQYAILNTIYSESEYKILTEQIIQELKDNNIYGEFFDASFSPFPYQDTVAQEHYPIHNRNTDVADKNKNVIGANQCNLCFKPFRILKQEQNLYHQLGVPAPNLCPNCRYTERMQRRNARKLHERKCMFEDCSQQFMSSYSEERPEIVYCEEHYQEYYN